MRGSTGEQLKEFCLHFLNVLVCTVRDLLHFTSLCGQRGLSVVSLAFGEGSVLFPCYCALATAYSRDKTD